MDHRNLENNGDKGGRSRANWIVFIESLQNVTIIGGRCAVGTEATRLASRQHTIPKATTAQGGGHGAQEMVAGRKIW
jgi:hypothetical protein